MQFELVFSLSLGEVLFSGLSCPGESEPPDDHGPASSVPDRQYTARQDVIKVHILVHVHWLAENSLYLSGPGSCFLLSTLTDLRHGMAAPRVVVGVRSGARWNFRYGSAPVIRGNSPKVEHFFRAWMFPQLIIRPRFFTPYTEPNRKAIPQTRWHRIFSLVVPSFVMLYKCAGGKLLPQPPKKISRK